MKSLKALAWEISANSRRKRAELFLQKFELNKTTRILDIGSENGENINLILKKTDVLPENVFLADINERAIMEGREKFGYQCVLVDESGLVPYDDKFFDVVYCSSVIEHVTIEKDSMWDIKSKAAFQKAALKSQKKFADEIIRIGKQYFVQTPAKYFPVESHTGLPIFAFLPRAMQLQIMQMTNKFWIKEAVPDFNLLTKKEMSDFFPGAEIVLERKFGLAKSIMAIKSLR